MILVMLILAYGGLNWSFPWWVWAIATLAALGQVSEDRKKEP